MSFTKDDIGSRMVNGRDVELSESEKQKLVNEWNAAEASDPLRKWQQRMDESDSVLPRWAEDILDVLVAGGFVIPRETLDRLSDKKALRATRPA